MQVIQRATHTIDASGKSVGRVASLIVKLLQGKHKPTYLPNVDAGDAVVVTNASKFRFTGKKMLQKQYFRTSGYLGGLKRIPLQRVLSERPEEVLRHAVRLMLPDNKLRAPRLKRLRIKM